MTTYADLQSQVLGLLNRRDATTAQIQAWIQNAIQTIQRELRVPAMEKVVQVTLPDNTDGTLTVPSDMLELIDIINHHGVRLTKEDVTKVMQAAKVIGAPSIYYRMGGRWLLGMRPKPGETLMVVYYAELGPLVNPTDENIMTDIAPDLITYKALSFAGDFYVDKRTSQWDTRYEAIKQDLQAMADADETSGASVVSLPVYWPDDGVAYGYP